MIEVKSICKNYGALRALDQITLKLEENKIYGLLGRNGAGKSTLLNIITNRIFENSGEVLMDGHPVQDNDRVTGRMFLVSGENHYNEGLKVSEIIKNQPMFYPEFNCEYAFSLAQKFELPVNKKMKQLSTGYQSIMRLILALSTEVPYIFLDEPVLGLDAYHRELFYRLLIENYGERPKTFVISSHLIDEISDIVEEIIILHEGKILKNCSRDELLSQGYTITGKCSEVDDYVKDKHVIGCDQIGGLKSVYIMEKPDKRTLPGQLEIQKMDLQKLFIQLTGQREENFTGAAQNSYHQNEKKQGREQL